MPKSISAVKDLLKRTEGLLDKVRKTIPTVAHKESKVLLREAAKGKSSVIKMYKAIIKKSEAFLAEQKKIMTSKAAPKKKATPKKKAAPKKKSTVKKAVPKKAAPKKAAPKKKTTVKKAAPKKVVPKKKAPTKK